MRRFEHTRPPLRGSTTDVYLSPCVCMCIVTECCDHINLALINTWDSHAQLEKIVVRERNKPWVSKVVRDLMLERDNTYKLAVRRDPLAIYELYRILRRKVMGVY